MNIVDLGNGKFTTLDMAPKTKGKVILMIF